MRSSRSPGTGSMWSKTPKRSAIACPLDSADAGGPARASGCHGGHQIAERRRGGVRLLDLYVVARAGHDHHARALDALAEVPRVSRRRELVLLAAEGEGRRRDLGHAVEGVEGVARAEVAEDHAL